MAHTQPLKGWLRVACGTVAVMCTTGCVTPAATRIVTPQPAPREWTEAGEGIATGSFEDLSRWWDRLGDQELSRLVSRALTGSIDLRTAQARLRQARAQWKVTNAGRFPSVSATGSAGVSDGSRSVANGLFSAGLDASWEPDVFGAKAKANEAAAEDFTASLEDLYDTQVSLTAEVALNYVALRQSQAQLDITLQNLASQSETLQLTTWRAQAGLVSELDVAQATTNRDQTAAQIPSLETSIAETEHRLAVLLGVAPGSLIGELSARAPIPEAPDRIAVGIPADALRQRPDVRAAEHRIIAETARVAQASTSRYPSFNLKGSLGVNLVAAAFSGGTSVLESITGSAIQTIFDAGRIRGQIEIQTAVQEQAVAGYEAALLNSLEDVENALVQFSKTRARVIALEGAAGSARQAASLANSRYQAGLTDFQSVLDTERTVLSVESALVSSQADRTSAAIRLYKALGGGWAPLPAPQSTTQEGRTS
jgi:outer membrane protein, multidrug efflux system